MLKKIYSSIVITIALFLIVACSSEKEANPSNTGNNQTPVSHENEPSETQSPEEKPRVPGVDDPATVTILHPWGMDQNTFMDLYGNSITKKLPKITFDIITGIDDGMQQLTEAVAARTNIDIVVHIENYFSKIQDLALATDLSDMIKKYNYDFSKWEPTIVQSIQNLNEGKIPGLPVAYNTMTLFYNKDLFSKFGVDYPKDKMTWDELKELATRMTREDGGVQYYGYDTLNSGGLIGYNQLSLPMVNGETDSVAFESDDWKRYLTLITDTIGLTSEKRFQGSILNDGFIKEGRIAMTITNAGTVKNFHSQNPDLDWDVANMPAIPGLPGVGTQAEYAMWYVTDTSKNRDIAFLTLQALTSYEVQKELLMNGYLSILNEPEFKDLFAKNIPGTENKNIKAIFMDQLAEKPVYNRYNDIASGTLNGAYHEILKGELDINTILRNAAENANNRIKERKEATS